MRKFWILVNCLYWLLRFILLIKGLKLLICLCKCLVVMVMCVIMGWSNLFVMFVLIRCMRVLMVFRFLILWVVR